MRATKNKGDFRHDAQLLKRFAEQIEEMKLSGGSPWWRHVARPRIEQNLRAPDKGMLKVLRRLDDRETSSDRLVTVLRTLADERLQKAG